MKMNIYKKLGVFSLLCLLFISCKEDVPTASVVQSFEEFPVLVNNITPIVVPEAAETYTINFPMDDRQIVAVDVNVVTGESSTATEGVDFSISTDVVSLEAYSGGGSFDITIFPDLAAEGDETIYITLAGDTPIGSPAEVEVLAITVRDSIYTTPSISLTWEGEIAAFPGNFWCSFIDIDMLIVDGVGADVTGFVGATAACVEVATADDIPDGTYTVLANLWANPITGNGLDNEILPVRMQIALGGVGTAGFVANDIGLTPVWNGDTPSDQAGAFNITMGTITVDGNIMTLNDGNGDFVGTFGAN